jgi:thiamine-monophosphate kinase
VSGGVALGPGAEFDAIRTLLQRWGARAAGIGDDAAVLRVPRGESLVASVDSAFEGRHFKRSWLSPREIGYRAVAAALSDLAAMAARPIGVLVAIALPPGWRGALPEIADGIGDAVELAATHIVGGNMSDAESLSITTTVLGAVLSPLTRAGARPGDAVYVTGRLGASAAALRRLDAGDSPGEFRERFAHPIPRLSEALWLATHDATSAIDISDGLVGDMRHVAHASGVAVALDAARIPCAPGVDVELAMRSGEEYELLVTAAADLDIAEFERRFAIPLTRIGEIRAGPAGEVDIRGVGRVANPQGYDHFSP